MKQNFRAAQTDAVPSDDLDVSDLIEMAIGNGRSKRLIDAAIYNEANKHGSNSQEEASGLSQVATEEGQGYRPKASDYKALHERWNYQASQMTEGGSDDLVTCGEGSIDAASRQIELEEHVGLRDTDINYESSMEGSNVHKEDPYLSRVAAEEDGQSDRPASSKLLTADVNQCAGGNGFPDDVHRNAENIGDNSATSMEQRNQIAILDFVKADECWDGDAIPDSASEVQPNNEQAEGSHISITCSECSFVAFRQIELEEHVKSDHPEVLLDPQCSTSSMSNDLTERFPCVECGFTADDKSVLQHHIDSKHLGIKCAPDCNICTRTPNVEGRANMAGWSLSCPHCDYVGHKRSHLLEHMRNVHSDTKQFKCSSCNYETNNGSHLKMHKNAVHLNKRDFECQQCTFKAASKCNLTKHINSVHRMLKKYSCPECEFKSAHKANIVHHMKVKHTEVREFKCDQCEYGAVDETTLKRHIESVHLGLKNFFCTECPYSTYMKGCLTAHIDSVHRKVKNFSCLECEYKAYYQKQMDIHVRTVHMKVRDYACTECNYKGHSRERLRRHIDDVHLQLKPFACDECDFRTAEKKTLSLHMKKIHLKVRDIPCDQCDYKASTMSDVLTHKRSVHAEKNLACPDCNYKTADNGALRNHIQRVHLKLKNFQCKECSFSTAYQSSLNMHNKLVHNKGQPLQCNECSFKSFKKYELEAHVDSVHKGAGPVYTCKECGLAAASELSIKIHKGLVHTRGKKGNMTHDCSDCNYTTADNGALQNHIERVHLKLKNFKCKECSFSTAYQSCLSKHMKGVHKQGKHFRCGDCTFETFRKHQLEAHVDSVHSGAGPVFTCKECGLAAATELFIKLHVGQAHTRGKNANRKQIKRTKSLLDAKQNSEAKPYNCSECSFGASRKSALKAHISTAHHIGSDDESGDMDLTVSCMVNTSKSLYRSRRSYRCQECENPDVPKGPFPKHIIISISRIDCINDSSGDPELTQIFGQLSQIPLERSLKTHISEAADLEFNDLSAHIQMGLAKIQRLVPKVSKKEAAAQLLHSL